MNSVIKTLYITTISLSIGSLLWFTVTNIKSSGWILSLIIAILLITVPLTLFINKGAKRALQKLIIFTKKRKYIAIIAVLASILGSLIIRFYIYLNFSYDPISDPTTFYESSIRISQGHGITGDTYIAFFPYLAAYTGVLGFAMHMISDPWLSVIVLNSTFDIMTALVIYLIVRLFTKKGSLLPSVGAIMWLINPFSVLLSVVSLPISAVNFFISLSILVSILLIKHFKKSEIFKTWILSVLLGLTLALGSSLRPVFVIFIIAISLVLVLSAVLSKTKLNKLLLASSSVLTLFICYTLLQHLNIGIVSNLTSIETAKNSSGWSVFVGANKESNGKWNIEDEYEMHNMCKNLNRNNCHQELIHAGVDRYKSYGIIDSLKLMTRKLYVFSSNQDNIYNVDTSVIGYEGSNMKKVFMFYLKTYLLFTLSISILYLVSLYKQRISNNHSLYTLLITLAFLGLFISTALVETSERYAQVVYPIIVILATLGIGNIVKNKVPR